jgi:hypothetical protein
MARNVARSRGFAKGLWRNEVVGKIYNAAPLITTTLP